MRRNRLSFVILLIHLSRVVAQGDEPETPLKPARWFASIDLQSHANQRLNADFHLPGNNLKILPRGQQKLGDVTYVIGEKLIFLAGKRAPDMPEQVNHITVNSRLSKLHFLHAGGWGASIHNGTVVGKYVIHFDDMTSEFTTIVYGHDIKDWWSFDTIDATRAPIVWSSLNHASKDFQGRRYQIRLYQMTWENPHPDKNVTAFDFVSFNDTVCSPFLVAASAETLEPTSGAAIVEVPHSFKRFIDVKSAVASPAGGREFNAAEPGDAIAFLRKVGAYLEYDTNGRLTKISLSGPGPNPKTHRGSDQCVEKASRIATVEFLDLAYSEATNFALRSVKTMSNLRSLNLNLTRMNDEGLEELKELKSLERLWLHHTQVTDDGLQVLKGLTNLKTLDLSNTEVTDAGLVQLNDISKLAELDLRETNTTAAGITKLRRALPKTRILRFEPDQN